MPICSNQVRGSARRSSRSLACCTRMRFADLDAVTVDGYGTLIQLRDPVPLFVDALAGHGVACTPDAVRAGVAAEVSYSRPNALLGRDAETLAALRLECTRIFLEGAGVDL